MSPPEPSCAAHEGDLRQTVQRPRESDGVGDALRAIFSRVPQLPQDLTGLMSRLNRCE